MQLDEKTIILNEQEELEILLEEYKGSDTSEHQEETKRQGFLHTLMRYGIYGLVFLMPLFFLPFPFDLLELNKQTLLLASTFIVALLYLFSVVFQSRLSIRQSPIYWSVGGILIAYLFSTIFSKYPYNSFVGIEGQEFLSFTTIGALAILLYIIINEFREKNGIGIVYSFISSMVFASIYALLQLRGIYIFPIDLLKDPSFTTIGSYTIWGSLLVLALILSVGNVIHLSVTSPKWGIISSVVLALCASFFLFCLLVLDDQHLWVSMILGLGTILLFLYTKLSKQQKITWILLPTFLIVVAGTMMLFDLPKNYAQLPFTVQPSLNTSFLLTQKTLSASPLVGYGPGNFQVSYTQFRPQEINAINDRQAWMMRFTQSGSYLLTTIISLGIAGFLAYLSFALFLAWGIGRRLIKETLNDHYILLLSMGSSLLSALYLSFVREASITFTFIISILCACSILLVSRAKKIIEEEHSNRFFILTSLALFGLITCGGVGLYFQSQRYISDVLYRKAQEIDQRLAIQSRSGQPINPVDVDTLTDTLASAVKKDSSNHTYLRSLSQAMLFKVTTLMRDRETLAANMATLQTLATSMIDIAKQAYTLNTTDVRNTYNLAVIYQAISPVTQGADTLAIEYFKKSLALDPNNPTTYVDLAKFYLSSAAGTKQKLPSLQNEDERKKATDLIHTYLSEAETYLKSATVLKPDFAIAHFLLSTINYERSESQEALTNLDKATSANLFLAQSANLGDPDLFYAIGSQYKLLGQKEKAHRVFGFTVILNPNYWPALWELALLDIDAGKKEDAMKLLTNILQLDPKNTAAEAKLKELQAPPPVVEEKKSPQKKK